MLPWGSEAAADQGHQVGEETGDLAVEAEHQRRGQGQPPAQFGQALPAGHGLVHELQSLAELPFAELGSGAEVVQQLGPAGLIETTLDLDAVEPPAAVGIEAVEVQHRGSAQQQQIFDFLGGSVAAEVQAGQIFGAQAG